MKKIIKNIIVLMIIAMLLVMQLPTIALASATSDIVSKFNQKSNSNEVEFEEGQAIIMYNRSTYYDKSNSIINELNIEDTVEFKDVTETKSANMYTNGKETIKQDVVVSLVTSNKYSTDDLIKKLKEDKSIMKVSKNYKVKASNITNEPYEKYQWAIENSGQNNGTQDLDINPVESNSSEEKVIAIVDTGVDYTHSDLDDIMWKNPYGSKLAGECGYDFVNRDDDPMDDDGHGTHCAGIIASESDNNEGTTGALLGSKNVKIMALKFLDESGGGNMYDAISAYNYIYRAQQLGTNVIAVNNSWCGDIEKDDDDEILEEIINIVGKAGALSICAAGNDGMETYFKSPACIDSEYIITVGASNEKDELATFSNYGYEVDIAAPGTDILSTVSYNVFNPSIYTENQQNNLCSEYYDFEDGLDDFKYKATEGTEVYLSQESFGQKGTVSLGWTIENAEVGKTYNLAIPLNAEKDEQYYSMMLKTQCDSDVGGYFALTPYYTDKGFEQFDIDENSLPEDFFEALFGLDCYYIDVLYTNNYWDHIYGTINDYKYGALLLQYIPEGEGSATFYIDDFAISSSTADEEDFGKYEFYNGTSMATPYVTAAVATTSNLYKGESILKTKERILGGARYSDSLYEEGIMIAGTLDLTDLENVDPEITSVTIDDNGNIEVKGECFGENPELYMSINDGADEKVNANYNKDTCTFTFKDETLKNKYVCFTVITEEGREGGRYIHLKVGKEFDKENFEIDSGNPSNFTTDGEKIYYIKDGTDLVSLDTNSGEDKVIDSINIFKLFEIYNETMVDAEVSFDDIIYSNNKIWSIATLECLYATESILVYYDLNNENSKWNKACEVPEYINKLYYYTMTTYNSDIYFIGGKKYNDAGEEEYSKNVYVYNTENNSWGNGVSLPSGRYGDYAVQVGDKMVLALGYEEDSNSSSILIFDGKQWKESKSNDFLNSIIIPGEYYMCSLVKDGIIIIGILDKGYGETIKYNVNTDSYEALENIVRKDSNYGVWDIVSVKDKLYAEIYDSEQDGIEIRSMPIESGMINVNTNITNNGATLVDNYNNEIQKTKSYLPGTKIELTVNPKDEYNVKEFKVNGSVVKGNKYSTYLTSDINIDIVTEKKGVNINNKISINKCSVSGIKNKTYTGQPLTQVLTVKNGNTVLNEGIDYKLNYINNNNTGKASVIITGIGNYTGTITKSFVIVPKKVTGFKVKSQTTDSITMSWSKHPGVTGYKIYSYNYSKEKWEYVAKTTNTSYKIKKLKAGTTYKYRVRAYKTVDGTQYFGAYTSSVKTATKPATPKITSISSKSKKATVKWKKVSGASGYEIYMSTSKDGKYSKIKTITKGSTVSYTKSNLTKNKKFYFKVRAYKTVDGKKVYSSYSTVKNVKIK